MTDSRSAQLPETGSHLLLMTAPPVIWMAHFLLSYVTGAVWCARFSTIGGTLGPVQTWVVGYTAVALGAIAVCAWGGYRRHTLDAGTPPHDADTPGDRHRFLGFATLLLAGLSLVATIYSAIAVFTFETC